MLHINNYLDAPSSSLAKYCLAVNEIWERHSEHGTLTSTGRVLLTRCQAKWAKSAREYERVLWKKRAVFAKKHVKR